MSSAPKYTASSYLAEVQDALRAGQHLRADTAISRWLEAAPEHPEALYFRAVLERVTGRAEAALATLAQVLAADPLHSRALQEAGHARRRLGDRAGALVDFQRATRLNPALVASWAAQAELLRALGQSGVAAQVEVQLAWLRTLPQPLLVVMDLIARGRLGKAEDLCKRFMVSNPRHVEGMRLLADIAVRLGALDEADLLLASAMELDPDNPRVAVDRVQLLRKRQRFGEARDLAERLAASDPDNLQFASLAAVEAMQVGDYDRALAGFDAILTRLPDDPVTLTSRGHALKTLGRTDTAVDSYRGALASQPRYGEAWYALANLKTYRFSDADVAQMEALCDDPRLEHASRIFLHFALGKACEDAARFDRAFHHYAAGNAAKRRQSSYDGARLAEEFARQREICDAEFLASRAAGGCPADDPIFVVGLPRAGSTLIEQILASHSQVDGTLELPNIPSLVQTLRRSRDAGYPDCLRDLDPAEFGAFGEAYLRDTRIHRSGAPRFIDKMPNNFRHLGLIHLMFPNARIIDARRNPMACCFSGFKQLFAEGQEFSYDLGDIGRYYRDYVALMAHWNAVLPGAIHRVDNEAVIADLEGEVRRLLDFCGLPFEAQCLRYWETERAIKTPSSEQVRKPVSSAGQHQWRNFEPWLGPLEDALGKELVDRSRKCDI